MCWWEGSKLDGRHLCGVAYLFHAQGFSRGAGGGLLRQSSERVFFKYLVTFCDQSSLFLCEGMEEGRLPFTGLFEDHL